MEIRSKIMNQVYWDWYKCIKDNVKNKAIKVGAKVEIKIGGWET